MLLIMALDVNGLGFIAYVIDRITGFVGFRLSELTLSVLGAIILSLAIIMLVLTVVPGYVWGMRKIMADIQSRYGPTRVGPFGLLQTLADGLKLMTKETIVPARADKWAFKLAPYLAIVPVLLAFAPLPWSGGIILANIGIGILFILAIGAISPLGEVLAGWSSNNKYSMYGGLRAAAMDVSYEIPMVISALAVVLLAGTLSTQGIVAAQQPWWFFVLQPLGVVIFFASAIAKIGVVPLDLPEAESELVAGYFTEYAGMQFGVFFLALFANIFLMAAVTVTLFFGGWALMPAWGIALVLLLFIAVLLVRQPHTTVNIGPPAIAGTMVGVVLAYFLNPVHGLGAWLLSAAWGPQVSDAFLGPAAPAGNFVQTFVGAWEFLVPAAITAGLVSYGLTRAERGTSRDARVFPAACISAIALPPVAILPLVPFLYTGTSGGIVHFFAGGLQTLLIPWTGTLNIVGLLVITAALLGVLFLAIAPFAWREIRAAGMGLGVGGIVALGLAAFLWRYNPQIDLSALVQLSVLMALPVIPILALLVAENSRGGAAGLLVAGIAVPVALRALGIMPASPILMLAILLVGVAAALILLLDALREPILAVALGLIPALVPVMLIPVGSFLLKTLFFSFMVFWLWFTLPRVRVDQFLQIGWKAMFPLSLATLVLAGIEAWAIADPASRTLPAAALAGLMAIAIIAALARSGRAPKPKEVAA